MPVSDVVKLDAKGVVIEYYTPRTGRRVLAVDNLDLQIHEGEFLAICRDTCRLRTESHPVR